MVDGTADLHSKLLSASSHSSGSYADFLKMHDEESATIRTKDPGNNGTKALGMLMPPLRNSGIFTAFATLANTLLGVSIVGSAYGFAQAGYVLGSCLFVLFGSFSAMGLHLLACSARTVGITPSSYYVVAHAALPKFTLAVDLAVAIKCFGVATSYLIVIGNLMPDAMRGILQHSSDSILLNRHTWITIAAIAIAPSAAQKSFSAMKYISTMGIAFVIFLVTMVFAYAVVPKLYEETCGHAGHACDKRLDTTAVGQLSHVLKVLSIFVFAFTCHQNIFSVCNELKAPTQKRLNAVIVSSLSVAVAVHLTLSWCAYRTFGSGVASNLLENYPHGVLLTCARLCVSLTIATGYPLQAHPSRRSLLTVVKTVQARYSSRHQQKKSEGHAYAAVGLSGSSGNNNSDHYDISGSGRHSASNSSASNSSSGSSNRYSPMRQKASAAPTSYGRTSSSNGKLAELPLYEQTVAKRRKSQIKGDISSSNVAAVSSMQSSNGNGTSSSSSSSIVLGTASDTRQHSASTSPVNSRVRKHNSSEVSRRDTSGSFTLQSSLLRNESSGALANGSSLCYSAHDTAPLSDTNNGSDAHDSSSAGCGTLDMLSPDSADAATFYTITAVFLVLTYVIAMLISDLGIVLEIVGATGSTLISYILPGSIYLSLHPSVKGRYQIMRGFALLQVTVGCIISPVCLFFIIQGAASH